MLIDRRLLSRFDWSLLGHALLIPLLGLIVLYSAGYDPDAEQIYFRFVPLPIQSQAFLKQSAFLGMGLVAVLLAASLPTGWLHRYAYLGYVIGIGLLIAVLIAGNVVNGSRRWLALGGFNLQPAEPMKVFLIVAMARFITRYPPRPGGYRFVDLVIPSIMLVIPMVLIARQPDLGSALSVGAAGAIMVLFAGVHWKTLATIAAAGAAAVLPAWNMLHPYQQRRVLSLINPEADPLGSGYHITQSKIAVGSGAFFGKGFLRGTQSQLEFLPEHTTDFVFSVLAEEWGFFGCMIVLALYATMLVRFVGCVAKARETFLALIIVGVAGSFFFNAVVNVGMVVGILPVVGITLPMFSYGGSSLLTYLFALGLVLGANMRRFAFSAD